MILTLLLVSNILTFDNAADGSDGFITKNGFWRGLATQNNASHLDTGGAGGRAMQFMLDRGHMSVYRTLMKRLDGTRSHRESLLQSFKGSLDIEMSAGVGTKIAATIYQHRGEFEKGSTSLADGRVINDITTDMLLPFVSFEGDTRAYQQDPNFQIPLAFRGITLDQDFDNPFSRSSTTAANSVPHSDLDDLAAIIRTAEYDQRYLGAANGFNLRSDLDAKIDNISNSSTSPLPIVTDPIDAASVGINPGDPLVYPNSNNNRYTTRIRAAVTLALVNPGSLYITVGGGLGGWDDHNNGTD